MKKSRESGGERSANGRDSRVDAATNLLSQQIWCWGQDIRRGPSNLLMVHGFERIPVPDGGCGASVYRLTISPRSRVILRGFGVFYGDDRYGGLFLRRYGFAPRLTPKANLLRPPWRPDQLPPLKTPRERDLSPCRFLLLDLIDWIRAYESWVAREQGIAYRRATLADWDNGKHPVIPAEEMAVSWRRLGIRVADEAESCLLGETRGSDDVSKSLLWRNMMNRIASSCLWPLLGAACFPIGGCDAPSPTASTPVTATTVATPIHSGRGRRIEKRRDSGVLGSVPAMPSVLRPKD